MTEIEGHGIGSGVLDKTHRFGPGSFSRISTGFEQIEGSIVNRQRLGNTSSRFIGSYSYKWDRMAADRDFFRATVCTFAESFASILTIP